MPGHGIRREPGGHLWPASAADYEDLNGYAAERVAKTESFRTSNAALKQTWKESGVVKTIRWYTLQQATLCPFCAQADGREGHSDRRQLL